MTASLTPGQQCGQRAAWWFAAWKRAFDRLPDRFGSQRPAERKVTTRLLRAVCRRDVNRAMGWLPE